MTNMGQPPLSFQTNRISNQSKNTIGQAAIEKLLITFNTSTNIISNCLEQLRLHLTTIDLAIF